MDTDILVDLFNIGYNHSSVSEYVTTIGSIENNLVVLGRNFAKHKMCPPEFIFLDKDRVVNISEDMVVCYGVFAKGRNLLLIDQFGQIIDVPNYPSRGTFFPITTTKLPQMALRMRAGH